MTGRFTFGLLLLAALTTLVGCNNNRHVSGKVLFADDGSPVPCGTVIFDNGTSMAKGPIQPDGSYEVGFEKKGNGIPDGTYKIRIIGAVAQNTKASTKKDQFSGQVVEGMGSVSTTDLIDRKYRDLNESGLTLVVDKSTKTYDIKVERAKK